MMLKQIVASFREMFQNWELELPPGIEPAEGIITQNGWHVEYKLRTNGDSFYLDLFAGHRMTNDRLYRIFADGTRILVAASLDVLATLSESNREKERRFYRLAVELGFSPPSAPLWLNAG